MVISIASSVVEEIVDNIKIRNFNVAVVGMGYVGLPLLLSFFQEGFKVLGLDIDETKINFLKQGVSYVKHIENKCLEEVQKSVRSNFSTDFAYIQDADAILICVPTPLNKNREPDLSYVVETTKSIAPYLKKGQLIVLESTTYPGTTEECINPILEKVSGLKIGQDIFVAYSPEREDPGNKNFNTKTIPKVIGGDDKGSREIARTLYGEVIIEVIEVSNTRTAEAVKLLENIFRSVNIALVNELKMVFQKMGIDIHEVINAAKSKPFGYMPFYPGPGLGGHCIPIDPFYLTWKAREYGLNTRFIELAGEVNTAMPQWVVNKVQDCLNEHEKPLKNAKILVLGLAYKENVDDMRESPSLELMRLLSEKGACVNYFDPWIETVPQNREHQEFIGMKSTAPSSDYDCFLLATAHDVFDFKELVGCGVPIVDTRNHFPVHDLVFKA